MARANSISVKQVSAAAKKSVGRVLDQNALQRLRPGIIVGFVPPWWWCGFVIRDPGVWTVQAADKLAVDVHRGIAAAVPAVKGGVPGAIVAGGYTTIGFAPPKEIKVIQE